MKLNRRQSCRALLVTPEREILLIQIANPAGGWVGWITPGGGIDEGESKIEALKRELKEELGFELPYDPPAVWTRTHEFPWRDEFFRQSETFFFVPVPKFQVASDRALTKEEEKEFREIRWWKIDDIVNSSEKFAPSGLVVELEKLLAGSLPLRPYEISV